MTKWDKWYEQQNSSTKAWLDARAKEDNKFAITVAIPSLLFGIMIGFLIGLGI